MRYEIRFAKITTNDRLVDRFLNSQEKISQDLTKAFMGKVYTLVEILSPWQANSQVGQSIINSFSNSYYQDGSTSDLANFEEALKKVNENLAQLTQNGETSWIGNLNSILAVIVENKIHLAQCGRAEAYIFREGKINHITYGLTQNQFETHPLKTFTNVISGELKVNDKILFANPDLFKSIDIESIKELATINSSNEALFQIAKILKKKHVNNVNVVLLDFLDSESSAVQTLSGSKNIIHLDKPLESIWTHLSRFWRQFLKPVLGFFMRHTKKAGEQTFNFTKSYVSKMRDKKPGELPKKKDIFENEFLGDTKEDNILKDEEITYSPEFQVHYYEQQKKEKEHQSKPIIKIWSVFSALIIKFLEFIWLTFKDKKRRPYLLVVVAVIILTILGLSINAKRQNSQNKMNLLEAQNTLKEAETLQKEAKLAGMSNDQDAAKKLYAEAIEKAESVKSNAVTRQSAEEVLKVSYGELDKLTATTRFASMNKLAEMDKEPKAVFVISGEVYLVTKDEIYKTTLNGGKPQKIASLPKNNGEFQFGAVSSQYLYLYTSSQKVYSFNLTNEKIALLQVEEGNWETANSMSYYAGNLYLLDGIIGQIYRHAVESSPASKGETYINSPSIDIKNSKSVSIDGSIYVLRANGEVVELQKGRLVDFSLKDLPIPNSKIENPTKIYTDTDITSIYILDLAKKRIVEFDKDGKYVHQYALPNDFEDIKDFSISSKAKKIWILNDGGLYEANL
jgi:type II secretory pathway pseudopilin PulG